MNINMTAVVKSADEAISGTTTPQDDDHLTLAVGAGETWEFDYQLIVDSDDSGAEFKVQLATPASSSGWMGGNGLPTSATSSLNASFAPVVDLGTSVTFGTISGVIVFIQIKAIVVTTTAGSVTLQWSTGSGAGGITTLKAGSVLRATPLVNDANHTYVVKSATESVTSSDVVQADDELLCAIGLNEKWEVELCLKYDGATAGDLQCGFSRPSGAYSRTASAPSIGLSAASNSSTACLAITTGTTTDVFYGGCSGAGTFTLMIIRGYIDSRFNAGSLALYWAQVASNGTATRVFQYSYLKATRIA